MSDWRKTCRLLLALGIGAASLLLAFWLCGAPASRAAPSAPAAPVIQVAPATLDATLDPDDALTHTLWLTNTGDAELVFTLHEADVWTPGGSGSLRPPADPLIAPPVWEQLTARGHVRVIITLREQADLSPAYAIADWAERGRFVYARLQETAARSGGKLHDWLEAAGAQPQVLLTANAIAATLDRPLLEAVAARPEVAGVDVDEAVPVLPAAPGVPQAGPDAVEWNIARIRADEAWATLGVTGTGATVGCVDTGVMYTHPALVAAYRGNLGGGSFDHNYHWFDFVSGQGAPYDDNGHGTFVTGVMVGDDGGANQIGVAPGARWIAVKACSGGGSCPLSALHAALAWMLAPTDLSGANPDPARRPQVVLGAWGSMGCDGEFQLDLMALQAAGILPVFGVGGFGPGCCTMASPADLPEAMTAGATNASDVIAPFSSRGPSCYGEIKPEVAAPGVNIRSSFNDGGYTVWSGAAASSAHLAGTAALVFAADPTLGPLGVEAIITATALCIEDPSCGGTPCPDGANNVYGWGRIDAFEAVSLTLSGQEFDIPWLAESPISGTLGPGEGLPVSVIFDAAGLAPGSYWGMLDVESNDPLNPHVVVPVTLTVRLPCDPVGGTLLSWSPLTPTVQEVVTFTAQATGTLPIAFAWDFGDGDVGAGAVVTHAYALSGVYAVALTATNDCGAETVGGTIAVLAEPSYRLYLPIVLRQ